MSGMLSTISNVLTTAVKSQFQTYLPLNHAMTVCHLYQQNKSSYKQQKLCFFIVILIMCNIRMKKKHLLEQLFYISFVNL